MPDAVRSADAPHERTRAMDRCVFEYLYGSSCLEDAVAACVAVLGPRPTLTVSILDADPQVQARLAALQAALEERRTGLG